MLALQFAEHWSRFLERLGPLNDRLLAELEGCWRDARNVLENQLRQLEKVSLPNADELDLCAFQKALEDSNRRLFVEPLAQWERKRPYRRALRAIETYDRSLDDLVRSLPESVPVNGTQALALVGEHVNKGMARRFARFRRKERALPLRAIVADEIRRLSLLRMKTEGIYFLTLVQTIRQLKMPGEITHSALCDLAREEDPTITFAEECAQAKSSAELLVNQADNVIAAWRRWPDTIVEHLSKRIIAKVAWQRKRKRFEIGDLRDASLSHRVEQRRAVETEVQLERLLEQCENRIPIIFQQGLEALDQERVSLLAELDSFIAWLRARNKEGKEGQAVDLPTQNTDVTPALSSLSEMTNSLKNELENIPETSETLARFYPKPRRRKKIRKLRPRDTVYKSFEQTGRPKIVQSLEAIETEHREVVQELKQAREVVAFGMEAAESEEEYDAGLAEESLQNALLLMEFHRGEAHDWRPAANRKITHALGDVFAESRMVLSRDRLGTFTYLARQGMRRAIVLASGNAVAMLGKALADLSKAVERGLNRSLIYIGWKPAPTAGKVEIITRPYLPQEFTVDLASKNLPMIYRRLFKFEAVEDPRFLVGREQEMDAIAQARSFWEAKRPVAILIIGQRGSGKTSLINCAMKRPLEGLEVVRGEFNERISTEAQMRSFLAELLDAGDPANLEEFLCERRRVVIIEELERTFLRQVGYYSGIRALQRLIASTCASTLWLLAINKVAFKFLDAAVNLSNSFSHRINAASAEREDLRQAIMLRHVLSGLRLQFAPPPAKHDMIARMRRKIRGEDDAETLFFKALEQESAGVYRTAFDIWLGQIDTAEGGLLYMKPLISPDLSEVINVLDMADLFTLVAIMEHGSLTHEEHAIVFQESIATSRAQIDELLAREIIELEPSRPGFRVRPEAMRVAKEALYRRNLL